MTWRNSKVVLFIKLGTILLKSRLVYFCLHLCDPTVPKSLELELSQKKKNIRKRLKVSTQRGILQQPHTCCVFGGGGC